MVEAPELSLAFSLKTTATEARLVKFDKQMGHYNNHTSDT